MEVGAWGKKSERHRCLGWEAVSDYWNYLPHTELKSRWKNGMSTASVTQSNWACKLPHPVITERPTFFCLLLLSISWISLQSPHASSFTFFTYYISTSNIDTTPTLNITYSPLINILQKIKETLLDINCPFFNQSTFSLLKNDLLEETGALTSKSFKNKEDMVPALQLPSKGKMSRSQITKT